MKDRNGKTIHVGHVVNIHDKTVGMKISEIFVEGVLFNSGVVREIIPQDDSLLNGGILVELDYLSQYIFAPTDLEVICKL